MSGKLLLDTNIIIALMANEKSVLEKLANAKNIFVPIIAIGELFYGAFKSKRVEENLAWLEEFVSESEVILCDASTAKYYGNIKNSLRVKGRPIPENDIWIAAIAQQHGLTLVTRDLHFKEISDLLLEIW